MPTQDPYGQNSYQTPVDPTAGSGSSSVGKDLLSLVPVVGTIASGIISRSQAKKDLARQNAYNHPSAVKARLAEADIPMSAMFNGGFSQQSDMPRSTNIDPSLGTAKSLDQFMSNRLNRMQLQVLENELRQMDTDYSISQEELRKRGAEADYAGYIRDDKKEEVNFNLGIDPATGESNRKTTMESKKQMQLANEWIARRKDNLLDMQNQVYSSLKEQGVQVALAQGQLSLVGANISKVQVETAVKTQQVQNMVAQMAKDLQATANMAQQFNTNELTEMLNQALINDMVQSDSGISGFKSLILKLIGGTSVNPMK